MSEAFVPRQRILWTQWGEWARSILRQFNEMNPSDYKFQGPHYVIYECGEFRLYPYGDRPDLRYSFGVRPQFLPGEVEPLWTFMVIC